MRFIILFSLLFSACSIKEYKLFQDENPIHTQNIQDLNISYKEKILIDDILVIDIYNLNKKKMSGEYIVSEDGEIDLPLINDIYVKGLTLKELNLLLTEKYKKYLNEPRVKSKVKNHKIYVFGEINTGVIPIVGNSMSIIEVIAKAGGLSDYAIRDRVRIISEHQGKYRMRTLDLTKLSTLNTHNLMVKYNSIVYVEPKSTKAVKIAIDDYLPFLKVLTTALNTFLMIDIIKGN